MPYYGMYDFDLELAKGNIPGHSIAHRSGRAPDGLQTTATDVWRRADAAATQQIWLAPTAARLHNIVSSSANDAAAGTGARTIRIHGLTSWSTIETSEVVTLNGTNAVSTVNSYVMINQMQVLTCGTAGPNVGVITATAVTDATVTALIAIGSGKAEQVIYGISSASTGFISNMSASINDNTQIARADMSIRVNEYPDVHPNVFQSLLTFQLMAGGTSRVSREFRHYIKFDGPAIVKLQGISSSADLDCSANFDIVIVTP